MERLCSCSMLIVDSEVHRDVVVRYGARNAVGRVARALANRPHGDRQLEHNALQETGGQGDAIFHERCHNRVYVAHFKLVDRAEQTRQQR